MTFELALRSAGLLPRAKDIAQSIDVIVEQRFRVAT